MARARTSVRRRAAPRRHAIRKRPVTDALRAKIRKELPEVEEIADRGLRDKVVEAWAKAIAESSFSSISAIPGAGNPRQKVLKKGHQAQHIRVVARMALRLAEELAQMFPDFRYDRDVVLAGALCHDVGKPFEFDPRHQRFWGKNKRAQGWPTVRHPPFGVHMCLSVGLPLEVAHIAGAHSAEGEHILRSHEGTIVHFADKACWGILQTGGLLSDCD
ncbi:MAG: HD domain-containing protein [Proteobacteria bacterium]|nr:HD domain-containing protein [Pseudomonadota bacterium]